MYQGSWVALCNQSVSKQLSPRLGCNQVNHSVVKLNNQFVFAVQPGYMQNLDSNHLLTSLGSLLPSIKMIWGQQTRQVQVFTCMCLSRACIEFTEHNGFSVYPFLLKKLIQVTDIMYGCIYGYACRQHSFRVLKDAVVSDTPVILILNTVRVGIMDLVSTALAEKRQHTCLSAIQQV